MNQTLRKFPIFMAIGIIAIMLIPQYVYAEVQTPMTETINLPPSTNDNDELVNPANGTIRTNRDTWSPMPEGMFVGGTIEESKMTLNELPIGVSTLLVTTEIQFSRTYLQNGASEFIVRLPVGVDNIDHTWYVKLDIWDMTGASYPEPSFLGGGIPSVWIESNLPHVATYSDVANIWNHIGNPETEEIWTDVSHNSWLSGNRLYVRLVAPILVDHRYVFSTRIVTNESTPMVVYWHPSDLASDNILSSHVSYIWDEAVDLSFSRNYPVPADAGWSFLFQIGIGNTGRDWETWYNADTVISWHKYVPVNAASCSGAVTFVFEFRTNYSVDLTYNLNIEACDIGGGTDVTVLSSTYWHDKVARDVIIAARPENITMPVKQLDGQNVVDFLITLTVVNPLRLQMMLEADQQFDENNDVSFTDSDGTLVDEVWFQPWSTCLIQDSVYNESWEVTVKKSHKGFWTGVGHWWDEHWIDIANVLVLAGGMFLMAIPGGQVFGLALLAGGIGLFLYDNVEAFRNLVDGAIGMVIDALKWLGNWLYKIGMFIWKALTWLVDQLVYYGSELVAMLIYFGAVVLPVFIILITMKLMSILYKLAKADMKGAEEEGRELLNTATGGRVG